MPLHILFLPNKLILSAPTKWLISLLDVSASPLPKCTILHYVVASWSYPCFDANALWVNNTKPRIMQSDSKIQSHSICIHDVNRQLFPTSTMWKLVKKKGIVSTSCQLHFARDTTQIVRVTFVERCTSAEWNACAAHASASSKGVRPWRQLTVGLSVGYYPHRFKLGTLSSLENLRLIKSQLKNLFMYGKCGAPQILGPRPIFTFYWNIKYGKYWKYDN